ncbi:phosphomannomutase, partial [candidate division FCPU426 bacterium]|nr:phosphomannomutase [candidate division FCPU426 bacterium]
MLKFGTSGLRGLVSDMTDQECYINSKGFVLYLLASRKTKAGDTVSLAGDLRTSTDRIMGAVARAITDAGCQVENCGKIPSPALMYHAMQKKQASVMVTGSHIPDDRNGIKFNRPQGEILKSDEAGVLEHIARVRREDLSALFSDTGRFREDVAVPLPEVDETAREEYLQRYSGLYLETGLEGKTIVVDQHSAVGRDILVEILQGLGATVIAEGRSDAFVPKDTENITEEMRAGFRRLADKHRPFAVVSMDGDSDRPMVTDEKGEFYRGDVLGAVVARFIHARFAAV